MYTKSCLSLDLKQTKQIAEEAKTTAINNSSAIEDLQLKYTTLSDKLVSYNTENQELKKQLEEAEATIDDQVNRSLRNTLIIKNVKEETNETWSQTKEVVKNLLVRHLRFDRERVDYVIERAHRGKVKVNTGINNHRNIYVRFIHWEDSEFVKKGFANINRENRDMKIRVCPMFSPKIQARQNNAMQTRRQLLTSGTIVSGYVEFPAILMVKTSKEAKYTKHSIY